jgi:hypothetical protein
MVVHFFIFLPLVLWLGWLRRKGWQVEEVSGGKKNWRCLYCKISCSTYLGGGGGFEQVWLLYVGPLVGISQIFSVWGLGLKFRYYSETGW